MASLHVTKPLHQLGDPSFPCTSKGIKTKLAYSSSKEPFDNDK